MNFKALKKGDVVDIISPATACTKDEITKIKNFIKKIGLTPRIIDEKLILKKAINHEFPSFAAINRFKEFKYAVENSESKIIWCARGGYGSAEILPFLQKMPKPENQKIFIGFSDIVSLTTFMEQKWNWSAICAPVLAQIALNKVSEKSVSTIINLLFGKTKELKYNLKQLNNISFNNNKCSIVGGCISVLAGNFGTKNQIDFENKILFLEDEGEDGERLDRYFNQIITILLETKKYPKAILLGNFLESNPHGTPKAKNIDMAIKRFIAKIAENNLKIPVLKEKSNCLGHSKNMMPLLLGYETAINRNILIQKL
ncbi:MAG: LD-carboxypeptidase [Rickettsiales bacterium]|nr:LD-carboxypeptidase [Rickettsiales bacterium]